MAEKPRSLKEAGPEAAARLNQGWADANSQAYQDIIGNREAFAEIQERADDARREIEEMRAEAAATRDARIVDEVGRINEERRTQGYDLRYDPPGVARPSVLAEATARINARDAAWETEIENRGRQAEADVIARARREETAPEAEPSDRSEDRAASEASPAAAPPEPSKPEDYLHAMTPAAAEIAARDEQAPETPAQQANAGGHGHGGGGHDVGGDGEGTGTPGDPEKPLKTRVHNESDALKTELRTLRKDFASQRTQLIEEARAAGSENPEKDVSAQFRKAEQDLWNHHHKAVDQHFRDEGWEYSKPHATFHEEPHYGHGEDHGYDPGPEQGGGGPDHDGPSH